jgi:hypothetical protein
MSGCLLSDPVALMLGQGANDNNAQLARVRCFGGGGVRPS